MTSGGPLASNVVGTYFSPSAQNLTSATVADGPGRQIKCTLAGSSTVLGLTGALSSTQASDPVFPGVDSN
jgi:hypothetical protein